MDKTYDLATQVAKSREHIEAVLHQSKDLSQRVFLLANMLRTLCPTLPVYAVVIRSEQQVSVGAVDEAGNTRPEWAELLRTLVTEGKPHAMLLAEINLPASSLLREEVAYDNQHLGFLTMAVPETTAPEILSLARNVLALCAEQLATRLRLDVRADDLRSLRDELAEQAWLADVGELSGSIAHSFNNFLNVIMLHIAVLEQTLSEAHHAELAEIRRQGTTTAALVKQFQQYRHPSPPANVPIDLNALVTSVISTLVHKQAGPGGPRLKLASHQEEGGNEQNLDHVLVRVHGQPHLPLVAASRADLKRLVLMLVNNAAAAAYLVGGEVKVRTEANSESVFLRVEDTGAKVEPKLVPRLFEPEIAVSVGRNSLELAACKRLVMRLQGRLRAQNAPESGVALIVELPIASC